ncbi:Protein tyrosine/serine phosphatase [Legionella massiliensis]|uniref:Protein tyrosine/serine phosphatase n=1 Tax=Legionella massiliensis TaxID=1034943 RepID=A0A078KW62_9GAMM|nr:tyrosine-protein phosphatase [Legionella massiliensis]CDZ75913.1 Protein tyrosine/serine phosphatase [Legionella massiliensis]CEE11651.1 hypothetical protein BN1094_00173 [Legionella massiliensis]
MSTKTSFLGLLCIASLCSTNSYAQTNFSCERNFPATLQVKSINECKETPATIKKTNDLNIQLVNALFHDQNLGATVLNLPGNKHKIVYRSANLAGAPLCMKSLVEQRQVHTIVNLYSGKRGYNRELVALEKAVFNDVGGKEYIQIQDFFTTHVEPSQIPALNKQIAQIAKTIANSEGNVLVHCLVGEHDTGVIFGVLQKCYNKLPIKQVINEMGCHLTQDISPAYQRAAFNSVAKLIKEFPCELINEAN